MSLTLVLSTLYLAGGLTILPLGLVILRENPRSPVNRATAIMLFSGALGTLLGALGRLLESQAASNAALAYAGTLRNFSYLWEFFFPAMLYLGLVYPRRLVAERPLHVLEAALFVPHLCHLALVLFFTGTADVTRPFDPLVERLGTGVASDVVATGVEFLDVVVTLLAQVHQQLFSLVNLAYATLAIHFLLRSRRRTASARLRGQVGIVLLGLALCTACYTAAKLLPVFFPYRPSGAQEGVLIGVALLVASGTIGFAIVRHKFLDMRNVARRTVLYGAAAVLFAVLYMLVRQQVERFAAAAFGGSVALVEAGFLVVAVIVFQPLLLGLEDLLEGLVRRRDRSDPQALFGDLARRLASEVDLRSMRARVEAALQGVLLVEGARLLTVEQRGGAAVLDGGDRSASLEPGSPLHGLLRLFESAPEPVLRADVERSLPSMPDADREIVLEWIQDFGLLVPIVQQAQVRGILGVGRKLAGGRFHAEDVGMLALLAQQIGVSLENLRLLSENLAKRVLEEEIQLASQIQKGLLPTRFPAHPAYAAHAMSLASKEVGGDYFDLFRTDERRLHLAIADVSGKGVPAAILMSSLRAALRSNVHHLESPAAVLERINRLLYESTSPEKFATFFYGTLDTETHELVYANAGHNYPIVVHADGSVRELAEGGVVLGVLPDVRYEDGRLGLEPGSTLFLYTDGVTEATNAADEEFGPERLRDLLAGFVRHEPQDVVGRVLSEVRAFAAEEDLADDVTMVVVRRRADGEVVT